MENTMYPQHAVVMVNVTTPDGELLDRFPVTHWENVAAQTGLGEDDLDNAECVGSNASQSLLCERIARYVEDPVPARA